jgi:hypothetical protein
MIADPCSRAHPAAKALPARPAIKSAADMNVCQMSSSSDQQQQVHPSNAPLMNRDPHRRDLNDTIHHFRGILPYWDVVPRVGCDPSHIQDLKVAGNPRNAAAPAAASQQVVLGGCPEGQAVQRGSWSHNAASHIAGTVKGLAEQTQHHTTKQKRHPMLVLSLSAAVSANWSAMSHHHNWCRIR